MLMGEEKPKYDFSKYRTQLKIKRTPTNERSYSRWGYYHSDPVREDFTIDEIKQIIRSGNLESLRQLSRYFYRTNSLYRNNIDFLSYMPTYDTVVIPVYQEGKGSKAQITKAFYNACRFIDNLDVPNTFSRITKEWLKNGIYFGILRTDGEKVSIQDLPLEYCRARFKDFNNLYIIEFNLNYFDTIQDKQLREEALLSFPKEVQRAWGQWITKKINDPWVVLPAGSGGVCFTFSNDQTPLLIASLPELKKLDDATKREETRDENELRKLLIQRMPIDSNGELVFPLEEVADIHASVADMLADEDSVDVLTTFGETDLESLQDSSAATQSADRLKKYKDNAWNALGRGQILFNPEGSSSLAYMIKKDETIMSGYLNAYETWIKYHINDKFARSGLSFDFEILPITVFNREDQRNAYFRGAQFGYSKMFAGVAMGIKQMDQLSLMSFENDFLDMTNKMVPLQSSYTTSGKANSGKNSSTSAEKTTTTTQVNDIDNKGGRPELPDEEKSEKTQANIAAEG